MKNLSFIIFVAILLHFSEPAVIGIDFGTDLLKISIVKPGFPFETVTDFNSRRLSPSTVAFYDGDRLFGEDAVNIGNKKPDLAYTYMKTLIGYNNTLPDDNILKILRFPLNMVENERGTITFKLGEKIHDLDEMSIEEIIGMLMGYAKSISEHFGKDKIRDCVITVPSFWTQYQRRAIVDAAESVGLSVLSLIDENTAAALQYGLDRVFENQTHIALIYNVGSVGTEVTIAKYQTVMKKDVPIRSLEVLAKSWDTTLGGLLVDAVLIKHFEAEYYRLHGTKQNITTNVRSNARMRSVAQKAKKVLSSNKALPVVVEAIDGEIDLHIKELKRLVVDNELENYRARFIAPIEKALKMANLTKEDLNTFEVIGGGSRIPKVKTILQEYLGGEVGVHLNGDESMALGAAFRGANMSNSFKVRFVGMTDISIYQVSVKLFEDSEHFVPTENQTAPWSKQAVLFPSGSIYGSRKVVSFTREHSFHIHLKYDDTPEFPPNMIHNILSFNVTGVEEGILKNKELGKPKIHLSFLLSDSGVYNISRADMEWEETRLVPEIKKKKTPIKPIKVTPPVSDNETTPINSTDVDTNSTETTTAETNTTTEAEEAPTMIEKKFVHTVHLNIEEYYEPGVMRPLNDEEKADHKIKLNLLNRKDEEKKNLGQAKSDLEACIYSIREKLESIKGVNYVSTEEARTTILTLCSENEDWIYGDGSNAKLTEFKEKHRELEKLANPIFSRAKELYERPKMVKKIEAYFTECKTKIEDWIVTKPQITELERNDTLFLINVTEESVNDLKKAQDALALTEEPAFTSNDIRYKLKMIKDKMTMLSRKRPLPKPKPKPKPSNDTTPVNATDTGTTPANFTTQIPENSTEPEPFEEYTEENNEL